MTAYQETFGMELIEVNGTRETWGWKPFWKEYKKLTADYNKLVRDWNRAVPVLHGGVQPVGRPLTASEAQRAPGAQAAQGRQVTARDCRGDQPRPQHVRTIVGKAAGTDRTTKKREERIEIDRQRADTWKRRERTGDALPKRIERVVDEGAALIKEAKGLGR